MAGASDDHNRIALNLASELNRRLGGRACEAFINDMKLKVSPNSSLFYYPDVFVVCDKTDNARFFRERPTVIFEVISPETERIDRREKFLAYQQIPTVSSYLILEQDAVLATLFRRDQEWRPETVNGAQAMIRLPEIGVSLPLGVIYERTGAAQATEV
jgi:Uma2 family endonuclease